ncbi:MAG: hypothetical protein O3C40_02140 [Planctomycetota bacterium]|nr:hypothetical protein [Planctomycetota bacterium]
MLTSEKSREVSRTVDSPKPGLSPLQNVCGVNAWAVEQASNYIEPQVAAIGLVPTTEQIVFERFFDESGGMQLVIHSPFGARINRSSWLQSDRKPRRAPELTSRLPSRSLRQT